MATNLDIINKIIDDAGPISRESLGLLVEKCLKDLRWNDTIFAVRTYLNVDLRSAEAIVFALYPDEILKKSEICQALDKALRDHIKYSKEKPFLAFEKGKYIIDKDRVNGILAEIISTNT